MNSDKNKVNLPSVNQSQNITKEKLKKFIPKGCAAAVTDDVLDLINNIENDTNLPQEYMEERLMSSMHLLGGKGVSIEQLTNAIKYCNLKQDMTNEKAWAITFPTKYDKLVSEGRTIASHVSMYNKSKLVIEIDKNMMVPVHITHQPLFHKAIQKQLDLMNGIGANDGERVSAHVQFLAAKELAEITKMPEDNSIELKIGASDAVLEVMKEQNDNIAEIVTNQREAFKKGMNIMDLQKVHITQTDDNGDIIDAEIEDK